MPKIMRPAVAGQFYPGQSQVLSAEIKKFLDNAATPKITGEVKCLIAPHAGYMYSGPVAAHAYKIIIGKEYEAVIVLAPSHRVGFVGAAVFDGDYYQTPLGDVPTEKEICQALLDSSQYFLVNDRADMFEHSLEVQVPFLQKVLKNFKIVPIVVGQLDLEAAQEVADSINKIAANKNVLLVASSDLSHYHPAPTAEALDQRALKTIELGNFQKLWELEASGQVELCGIGPVMVVSIYAQEIKALTVKILKYNHSGEVTGDNSGVVGYGAVAFIKE